MSDSPLRKTPWIVLHQPRPAARVRRFGLPFAGGGASSYRRWTRELPAEIEVVPVQLPGRETRYREPPVERIGDLVDRLVEALRPFMAELPYALFGHSLGAIVALETIRALTRLGGPLPARLIVSARAAPHLPLRRQPVAQLSREGLQQWLRQKNGTPEAILQSSEMLDMILPALRADLHMDDSFQAAVDSMVECDLTAIAGLQDEEAMPQEMEEWSAYANAGFRLHLVEGGHFFAFNEGRSATVRLVADALSGCIL